MVDSPAFRDLLRYMRPNILDADIPHHKKLREEVLAKADKFLDKLNTMFNVSMLLSTRDTLRLLTHFQSLPSKVSFTFDTWTSRSMDPYLALTAHYIESTPDQPLVWRLKTNLIGFIPLVGNHSGKNQARHIHRCIDRIGLHTKVRTGSCMQIWIS